MFSKKIYKEIWLSVTEDRWQCKYWGVLKVTAKNLLNNSKTLRCQTSDIETN